MLQTKLDKIRDITKPKYDSLTCWTHTWPHIQLVKHWCQIIAEEEGIDDVPCIISAYCHDLGKLEEERLKKEKGVSPPHALLSIEPTCELLKEEGISGAAFWEIIEAVAVHSYRIYEGGNNIAKVLMDADKIAGAGPRGVLGVFKYFGGKDYIEVDEIRRNEGNREKLKELCEISLPRVDPKRLEKTLKGFDFVIEWYDMLYTKTARSRSVEEFRYIREAKQKLIELHHKK